jgi:DNA (cytosine-5)-methyltransferase 1
MTVYFNFLDDVYYNEFDPYAAAWLRNLIAAGHIAPGEVDTRSIEDVHPSDLQGFTQCHFFAGIGVWSLALRRAGWPDDRPVWTGSCPCQPFSAAGQGAGFDDERHLWPHFFHLIGERRPAAVLGEQVASKDADPWIDLVQDDLEGLGYRVGAVPFPSAGVGAPHIRDRLYWVARADSEQHNRSGAPRARRRLQLANGGAVGGLADAHGSGLHGQRGGPVEHVEAREQGFTQGGAFGWLDDTHLQGLAGHGRGEAEGGGVEHGFRTAGGPAGATGESGGLAYADHERRDGECPLLQRDESGRIPRHSLETPGRGETMRPGPTNGFWRAADWLGCRDGKWRPVEPGTFPLAHGASARVGRLRAYGNAINAEAARVFIEAVMEAA